MNTPSLATLFYRLIIQHFSKKEHNVSSTLNMQLNIIIKILFQNSELIIQSTLKQSIAQIHNTGLASMTLFGEKT